MLNVNVYIQQLMNPVLLWSPFGTLFCSLLFLLKTRNMICSPEKASKDCTFLMALCVHQVTFLSGFFLSVPAWCSGNPL